MYDLNKPYDQARLLWDSNAAGAHAVHIARTETDPETQRAYVKGEQRELDHLNYAFMAFTFGRTWDQESVLVGASMAWESLTLYGL